METKGKKGKYKERRKGRCKAVNMGKVQWNKVFRSEAATTPKAVPLAGGGAASQQEILYYTSFGTRLYA